MNKFTDLCGTSEFNKKEKEIRVSNGVRFFVAYEARMPYNMLLDRTMHKTVGTIQFNCGNIKLFS